MWRKSPIKRQLPDVDDYNDEYGGKALLKLSNNDVCEELATLENIRSGSFHYTELEEVYFMNDLDILSVIENPKKIENVTTDQNNIYMLDTKVDKVCIIRFPLSVCNEIKKCLLHKNLDLDIYPTSLFNSRYFVIHFKNLNKKFNAVLTELSTHIEVHKTLDGNNLYKSCDVSQMLYVFDDISSSTSHKKKKTKKLFNKIVKNNYQLNCGISNKINKFHFENYAKMFKYHDIYFAQQMIYDYLNSHFYDYYDIDVKTYKEMNDHVNMERQTEKHSEIVDESTDISQILSSLDNSFSLMKYMEKEHGKLNFETLLQYEIDEENYESDVSDLLLGGSYYLNKKK